MDILKSFTLKQVAGWTIASDLINYIMQKTFSWLCQTKYLSPLPKRSRHSNIIPGNPLVFTKDAVIPTCTLQLPPGVVGYFQMKSQEAQACLWTCKVPFWYQIPKGRNNMWPLCSPLHIKQPAEEKF